VKYLADDAPSLAKRYQGNLLFRRIRFLPKKMKASKSAQICRAISEPASKV
jgi:hypothetical protein